MFTNFKLFLISLLLPTKRCTLDIYVYACLFPYPRHHWHSMARWSGGRPCPWERHLGMGHVRGECELGLVVQWSTWQWRWATGPHLSVERGRWSSWFGTIPSRARSLWDFRRGLALLDSDVSVPRNGIDFWIGNLLCQWPIWNITLDLPKVAPVLIFQYPNIQFSSKALYSHLVAHVFYSVLHV